MEPYAMSCCRRATPPRGSGRRPRGSCSSRRPLDGPRFIWVELRVLEARSDHGRGLRMEWRTRRRRIEGGERLGAAAGSPSRLRAARAMRQSRVVHKICALSLWMA